MLVHSKEITPHAYLCEVDGMILEHNQTWHNEDSSGFCRHFFPPQECVSFTLRAIEIIKPSNSHLTRILRAVDLLDEKESI